MSNTHALWVMLIGGAIVLAALVQSGAMRLRIPGAVGLIALGLLASLVNEKLGFMTPAVRDAFGLLGDLGLVALLFRVGLDSKLARLLMALPSALAVWVGDVGLSSSLAFVTAHYVLGYELVPSFVVAVALSATSIGVSVVAWQEAHRLASREGQLTLDVAELDDISGVVLLTLLFTIVPLLLTGGAWGSAALAAGATLALKLALFAAFCVAFARFVEPQIGALARRLRQPPARMLVVAGVGFMIAAIADLLGFSLAVGALFAGLVFSRDPAAVKTEARFDDLYAFFTPFFFIGIGLAVESEGLAASVVPALVLCVAAAAGKLLGGGLPALAFTGAAGAFAIGVSLIPRAEIALYVAHEARAAGAAMLPPQGYAALVFVSLATSLAAPIVLRRLLQRPFRREAAHR